MKTKNLILSSLMALGVVAVSCSKQDIQQPQSAARGLAPDASAKFGGIRIGDMLVGSGNDYEVPFFFPNSEGISLIGEKIVIPTGGQLSTQLTNNTYEVRVTNRARANGQPDFSVAADASGCGAQIITGVAFDGTGAGEVVLTTPLDFSLLPATCGFNTSLSNINIAMTLRRTGGTGATGNISNVYANVQFSPQFQLGLVTQTSTGKYAAGLLLSNTGTDYTVKANRVFGFGDDLMTVGFMPNPGLVVGNLGTAYDYAVNYIVSSGGSLTSMMPAMGTLPTGVSAATLTTVPYTVDFPIDGISYDADFITIGSFWYDPTWTSGTTTNSTISVGDFQIGVDASNVNWN